MRYALSAPSSPCRGRTYRNHKKICSNHERIYGNRKRICGNHKRINRNHKERTPNVNTIGPSPGALAEGEFMEKPELVFAQLDSLSPIHEMIIDQGIENRIWTIGYRTGPFVLAYFKLNKFI